MSVSSKTRAAIEAMRPGQWVKNFLVLAPFFFAYGDKGQGLSSGSPASGLFGRSAGISVLAMVLFCLVSSGIYIFNDLSDAEEDARHPVKKLRPIASGALPRRLATVESAALIAVSAVASAFMSCHFFLVVAAYLVMQLCYTCFLKRVALLDVMVIAAGFVMRAVAGAVAIGVDISPWLILCTFFISLFLALCKRRQEKVINPSCAQRQSLASYSVRLLDLLISISATSTIVAYSLYTVSPKTVAKFGTEALGFTVPFVVYGVFRYLQLVFMKNEGERPEKTLLADRLILAAVALFLVVFAFIVASAKFGRGS